MERTLAFRAALTRRILVAAGVASSLAVACSDDTGTGAGAAGGGGQAQGGDSQGGGGEAQGGGGSAQGGGGQAQGGSGPGGAGGAGGGVGGSGGSGGGGQSNVERCFFKDPKTACPPIATAETIYICTEEGELITDWISGPTEVNGECCYQLDVTEPGDPNCAVIGRPFVVNAIAQRAPVVGAGRAWGVAGSGRPSLEGLSAEERASLAKAWSLDAAYEHASVASFSKFSLELMALGAPAHLVAGAHEAALDEVRHASLGFALASAYADAELSPGKLEAAASLELATTLEALAVAAVKEGCVGETLAALVAGSQLAVASDAAVRAALAQISEDETRHAELAWRTVAWAIESGGESVKEAVRGAFVDAMGAVEAAKPSDEVAVHSHGRLSGKEAQAERIRGVREVVLPAMRALMG